MSPPALRWWIAVLLALPLALAQPPARWPTAEFLVLPGLAAWYWLATTARGRSWHGYWFGCAYMACFSWSVRHVLWPAYAAIVLLGGCYFAAGTAAVRPLAARWRALGFGLAVAATFWLRSVMPEIHYPHGQPCHSLWRHPALLGALPLGGEPLANLLLGWLAAAVVDLLRCWRLAVPSRRAVGLQLLAVGLLQGGAILSGWPATAAASPARVVIAAVEPRVHPFDAYANLPAGGFADRYRELLVEHWLRPTREILSAATVPDLVLWPESSLLGAVPRERIAAGEARLLAGLLPAAPTTRLLVGGAVRSAAGETPAALLLDTAGRVLGHQEKQCLVPGGEFVPLLGWLPDRLAALLREAFAAALGSLPDVVPGAALPPLQTAAGVPFGALLCYDNAFPQPAARQVLAGAQFLCVLSNEAWYRGGAELDQLAAMTVCRARELGVPIVRCTTDGWTLAVDAAGRVIADLPPQPAATAPPRILTVELAVAAVPAPAMAWLQAWSGPLAAVGLLLVGWAGRRRRDPSPTGGLGAAGTEVAEAVRTGS